MERINYHHLYLFWTLAHEGTFTKTSEKLRISQSAVTAQIKSLEETLGLNLIDRANKRKPVLTSDGREVLEFANSIFETGHELLKWAKQGLNSDNQVLRIGALSGLSRNFQYEFLKPIVGKKQVKVEVTTGDQEKLVKLLKEHSLDLILSSHNVSSEGRITFHSHVLKRSQMVFVVASKNKIKNGELKDYLSAKSLCLPGRSFECRPEIDSFLDRQKYPKSFFAEIDDIALLRLFAVNSDSVVLIPEMGVLNEVASKQVEVIASPKGLEQKFYLISRQRKNRNPLAELLIESIQRT